MPFRLDHLIITVPDLATATADYQAKGFTVIPGGVHASGATHNALICLQDGSYLELLAKTGEAPRPGAPDFSTWFDLGMGLIGYALRSDDLTADVAAMRSRGVPIRDPQAGSRTRPDGVLIQWQNAMLVTGSITPFFIEDITPRNLRVSDEYAALQHANGATHTVGLNLVTHNLATETARLEQLFGITPTIRAPEATSFVLANNLVVALSSALPGKQSFQTFTIATTNLDQPLLTLP